MRIDYFGITTIAFIVIEVAPIISHSVPINQAVAQQSSYLTSRITNVPVGSNASAIVFCKNGDNLLSGGYSIGFSSIRSAQHAVLYANHPLRYSNSSGIFEGWKSGLINNGNISATITAISLCLSSTTPP
jgi:hypothetical protein